MISRQQACAGLIAAIYEDAVQIPAVIVQEITARGISCSLNTEVCRQVFSAEWFFARAVWLEVKAPGISDPELQQTFRAEIDSAVAQVLQFVPDLVDLGEPYFTMATMFEEGRRDPSGLRYGPGPFIVERYRKHVAAIRREFNLERLTIPDEEALAIMLLGDSVCWQLNGELEGTLTEMLNAS
jgi:hypothetical protein